MKISAVQRYNRWFDITRGSQQQMMKAFIQTYIHPESEFYHKEVGEEGEWTIGNMRWHDVRQAESQHSLETDTLLIESLHTGNSMRREHLE